jgi:hypothetical protein
MQYTTPLVEDFGSIADHTFSRCYGGNGPPKDWQICGTDKHGDCSCS